MCLADQMCAFIERIPRGGWPPQNFPCLERAMRPASTFLEMSRLYISFRIFLNGVMSISWRVRLSTPYVTAIYLTLCLGKKISI